MPDVIIGLSLLLLFVSREQLTGWPSRGFATITIAHITFSLAYVAVAVVKSRLSQLDPSLEEAAMDLGASPLTVYRRITLPLIAPALLAGWLLAFTLSLDDLVVASFVSGPGSTTPPMVVYSSVRLCVSPQINALATLILLFVGVAVLIVGWAMGRQRPRCGRHPPPQRIHFFIAGPTTLVSNVTLMIRAGPWGGWERSFCAAGCIRFAMR